MLPQNYRFTARNETGQTVAISGIEITGRRWKFGTDGTLSYETSPTQLFVNNSTIANGEYANGNSIDNSSDLYLGGHCEAVVTAPASADGNISLFYQCSASGNFPSSGEASILSSLSFSAAGTLTDCFEIG